MERLITLTRDELLRQWQLVNYHEPLRTDCTIRRTYGIDVDQLHLQEAIQWYYRTLAEAPFEQLPLTDVTTHLTVERAADGTHLITLPSGCLRVASLSYTHWMRPAIIVTDVDSAEARLQLSPFSRAGIHFPVAVQVDTSHLIAYTPHPADSAPSELLAVTHPDPDTDIFTLTPSMLALMNQPSPFKSL